jgi:hypothetical protein
MLYMCWILNRFYCFLFRQPLLDIFWQNTWTFQSRTFPITTFPISSHFLSANVAAKTAEAASTGKIGANVSRAIGDDFVKNVTTFYYYILFYIFLHFCCTFFKSWSFFNRMQSYSRLFLHYFFYYPLTYCLKTWIFCNLKFLSE